MEGIFSDNKYINTLIIILLFLVGINVFHYGQLLLPIICLLIFIDRKMQFTVVSPGIFVILCLFAVSFYAFSHELGSYSVMAFTFPMAYYIGSNIRACSSGNIRKIILLFAFAMGLHIFLDIMYELSVRNVERIINSSSHYDIWLKDKMVSTAIAIDLVYLISSVYYLLYFESNRIIRYSGILLFGIDLLFCLIIGRRTSLFLSVLCIAFSFVYHGYLDHSITQQIRKGLKLLLIVLIICSVLLGIVYLFDIDSLFDGLYILNKIKNGLFDQSRIDVLIQSVKLMPYHLWGGQEISSLTGLPIHELWLDVYDYAGIISYLLLHCYTFSYLLTIIRTHKSDIEDGHKIMFMTLFLAVILQSFIEPLMTGMSIFLIVSIVVGTMIERLHYYEQQKNNG